MEKIIMTAKEARNAGLGFSPLPFPGTADEAAANNRTHSFWDGRCDACTCRPWGDWANYPCGDEALADFLVQALVLR
jgi:hypothetical protein